MVHKAKPKTGMELKFAELKQKIDEHHETYGDEDTVEADYRRTLAELEESFDAASISVYEAIGAPKIGHDARATTWWREHVYGPTTERAKEIAEKYAHIDAARSAATQHDVEWARKWLDKSENAHLQEARGRYVPDLATDTGGNASITGMIAGPLDFRGKIMRFIEGIPDSLVSEAWEDHSAIECVDYANRLEPYLKDAKPREDLQAAIDWLRFWGSRGFGYWAWY
jgi:hypothetical protein